jgi:hypothetical protein
VQWEKRRDECWLTWPESIIRTVPTTIFGQQTKIIIIIIILIIVLLLILLLNLAKSREQSTFVKGRRGEVDAIFGWLLMWSRPGPADAAHVGTVVRQPSGFWSSCDDQT